MGPTGWISSSSWSTDLGIEIQKLFLRLTLYVAVAVKVLGVDFCLGPNEDAFFFGGDLLLVIWRGPRF